MEKPKIEEGWSVSKMGIPEKDVRKWLKHYFETGLNAKQIIDLFETSIKVSKDLSKQKRAFASAIKNASIPESDILGWVEAMQKEGISTTELFSAISQINADPELKSKFRSSAK